MIECLSFEPGIFKRENGNPGRICKDVSPTLRAEAGDNKPAVCYSIEGNGSRPSHKGNGYSDDGVSYTLNSVERHAVCYALDSTNSNSMKSKNPHSGFHEENVVKTLDTNPDPTCNQGGNVIVQCYEQPGEDKMEETKTYAMQAFGAYKESDQASSCKARDWKDATDLVTNKSRKYIVRRLTPLECCRLQGFPDWWTDGAGGNDTAKYKMWGNGIALPCAVDVLGRIVKEIKGGNSNGSQDA